MNLKLKHYKILKFTFETFLTQFDNFRTQSRMMGYEKVGLLTKNDDSAKLTNKVAGATKPVAKTVDCQNKEDTVIGDSQEEEVCVKFERL